MIQLPAELKIQQYDPSLLVVMGSRAYGCDGEGSDTDIYGITVPSPEILFPAQQGYIQGFNYPQPKVIEQYEIKYKPNFTDDDKYKIEGAIYSISKFFFLSTQCNPNIIDSLYCEEVLICDEIGKLILDNKDLFLSKKCRYTFSGYAFQQKRKLNTTNKEVKSISRRKNIDQYGFDVKYAYHLIRLMLECLQILKTGTLNLKKDKDIYLDIRSGKYTLDELYSWFNELEDEVNLLYETSELQYSPDIGKIKKLLIDCLELKYGNLAIFGFKNV